MVSLCHSVAFCLDLHRIFEGTVVSFSTASSGSTNKKGKSSPKKVEKDDLAQLWSKQTLAAAIAKQLTNQRTIFDISKAFNVEKVRLPEAVCTGKRREMLGFNVSLLKFFSAKNGANNILQGE